MQYRLPPVMSEVVARFGITQPEGFDMAKFSINKLYNSSAHKQDVEADFYRQEGDYFVFYNQDEKKVLTVAAARVQSIDTDAK
jgi:hypothetical protein